MAKFNTKVLSDVDLNRREPQYITEGQVFDPTHYYIPEHYRPYLSSLLVPYGMIVDRVEKLAHDISQDYGGHTIHMLCVLKGK